MIMIMIMIMIVIMIMIMIIVIIIIIDTYKAQYLQIAQSALQYNNKVKTVKNIHSKNCYKI